MPYLDPSVRSQRPKRLSSSSTIRGFPQLPTTTTSRSHGDNVRLIFIALTGTAGALMTLAAPVGGEASTAAQTWISLVDNQQYAESWNQAGSKFHDEVRQER